MAGLSCPRCASNLVAWTVRFRSGVVTVEVCDSGCGGVWLDPENQDHGADLLEAIRSEADAPPSQTSPVPFDRHRPIACPVCRATMRRYRWNYGSYIVLDQCEQGHGTWLDGGEVGEMVEIMDGTVPPISPEERERIRARLAAARSEVKVRLREASRRSRESWLAYLRMIRVRGDHFLW